MGEMETWRCHMTSQMTGDTGAYDGVGSMLVAWFERLGSLTMASSEKAAKESGMRCQATESFCGDRSRGVSRDSRC